jgi:hypothetical protein
MTSIARESSFTQDGKTGTVGGIENLGRPSMSPPRRARHGIRLLISAALPVLALTACGSRAPVSHPSPAALSPTATLRERIAALALRQTVFGAISLIPVRFERSRISKPFLDGGRTLYCVSSRMKGRDFGEAERPKVVIQERGGVLSILDEDAEICEGNRTEPFPELDTPAAGKP